MSSDNPIMFEDAIIAPQHVVCVKVGQWSYTGLRWYVEVVLTKGSIRKVDYRSAEAAWDEARHIINAARMSTNKLVDELQELNTNLKRIAGELQALSFDKVRSAPLVVSGVFDSGDDDE